MKKTMTKQEIEKQAEIYLTKCASHLFVRETTATKWGTKKEFGTFYKVFPMWINEDLHYVTISLDKNDLESIYKSNGVKIVKVYSDKLFDYYGDDLVNVLKNMCFFPQWHKYKAVKNFKKMKNFIIEFKHLSHELDTKELSLYIKENLSELIEKQYEIIQ